MRVEKMILEKITITTQCFIQMKIVWKSNRIQSQTRILNVPDCINNMKFGILQKSKNHPKNAVSLLSRIYVFKRL